MIRNNLAKVIVITAVWSMLSVGGCKKKKANPSKQSTAPAAMGSDMRPAARADMRPAARADMRPVARPARPVAAAGTWKPGALPIPADAALIRFNLKAARATQLYKTFQAKLKAWVDKEAGKDAVFKAMVTKCGMNPLTAVDEVILGAQFASAKSDMVLLVKGSFDVGKVMACMAPVTKDKKVKDVTIAGKKGGVYKDKKGEQSTVLPLDAHTILFAAGKMQGKLDSLLGGKASLIGSTPLFKKFGPKVSGSTLLAVLVPKLPASATAKMPLPVLKGIKSVALLIGMPAGGLDVQGALDVGKPDQATKLAAALPMFLGMAKAKLGPVGAMLTKHFQSKADGAWVKLSLVLPKADFDKLVGKVKGLLGNM